MESINGFDENDTFNTIELGIFFKGIFNSIRSDNNVYKQNDTTSSRNINNIKYS